MSKNMGGKDGGGLNLFGKTQLFEQPAEQMKVLFKDVAGLQQAKIEIQEFVDFLKHPEKYTDIGARIPTGLLLYGPPGTGKTLLGKASAGEAGVPIFYASGSEFVEIFVGVGASRIRDLFEQAKKKQPAIIFIDEIDAVGKKRGNQIMANDEGDNTLNQLLVEMDGFNSSNKVIVMAATNRMDMLDSALTRAGRFDRIIEIQLPNIFEREQIFKIHLQDIHLDPNISIKQISRVLASQTPGFSGAQIASLCNESAIHAARNNRKVVEMQDFEQQTERVIAGLKQSQLMLTDNEKNVLAIHESGHAVVSWFLEGADSLVKITIIPRTNALGFNQYLPDEVNLYTKQGLKDRICSILGGRVAEEIFIGKITTGAADDLQKVYQIAYAYVTSYGFSSKIGNVAYKSFNEYGQKQISEKTSQLIDQEIQDLIQECTKTTRQILVKHEKQFKNLSEQLLENEVLVLSDIIKILGKRPFKPKSNFKKFLEYQQTGIKSKLENQKTKSKKKQFK